MDQFGESVTLTLNNPTNASLGTPVSHTINVIENEFSDPSLVVNQGEVCINYEVIFTADPPQGNCGQIIAFYYSSDGSLWQQIPNAQLSYNGCNITYTPPAVGTYFYYFEHSNFGNSNVVGVTVLGVPEKPGSISGNTTLCPVATGETYSIDPVPGANNYTWTVPTGWSITAGQGSTEITVSTGTTGGTISVVAVNDCGISDNPSTLSVSTQDNEAPAITCPANQTFDANNTGCTFQVIDNSLDASATDNCVIASITHNYIGGGNSLNGESFPVGTTTVSWTAIDGGGLESTCTFDITVVNPVSATISTLYVEDCPDLEPLQGFNPQSGSYNAGSTDITFEVTLSGTSATIWSFDYELTGADISVRASGVPTPNFTQSGSITNTSDNPVVLTFYVDNNPPIELYPTLEISNITDGNGCNAADAVPLSVTIKAMPDVGDYE